MRSKIGICFMVLGAVLLLGAFGLLFYNAQEAQEAELFSMEMIQALQDEVYQIQQEKATEVTEQQVLENTPEELLTEADLVMTETVIKGHAYIGYLSIPDLELYLPVMSQWNDQKLRISPCRYYGTLKGQDLVLMAHSYASHFGRLSTLSEGAQVLFTDMDGVTWDYEIAAMDILGAYDVEDMTAGEYDLTLFTCTKDRQHRVTVRCNRKEK